MSKLARQFIHPQEYLRLEDAADYKNEYYNGKIYPMTHELPIHNNICARVIGELGGNLRDSKYYFYNSNQRIHVETNGFYTYPDVSVVCGSPILSFENENTITNPILIAEVLSPSTTNYDRGQKFVFYRGLTTLQHYILVDSQGVYVEYLHKISPNTWQMTTITDCAAVLELPDLNIELSLARIYDRIEFEQAN